MARSAAAEAAASWLTCFSCSQSAAGAVDGGCCAKRRAAIRAPRAHSRLQSPLAKYPDRSSTSDCLALCSSCPSTALRISFTHFDKHHLLLGLVESTSLLYHYVCMYIKFMGVGGNIFCDLFIQKILQKLAVLTCFCLALQPHQIW